MPHDNAPLSERVTHLVEHQLRHWQAAGEAYAALQQAEVRTLDMGDALVVLQHNAARIRSTAAHIDAASLAARPCFLCREHQPDRKSVV